jgi:hypothetical protein
MGRSASKRGGSVAERRDPDTIVREIEQTRAELADTIDAIADRLSPRRAVSRGLHSVKAQVGAVRSSAPASVLDAPPAASGKVDTQARRRAVQEIARTGGGAAYTGTTQFTVSRRLRVDRVLIAAGVVAAAAGVAVLWRSRR